jgi:hypothetical protein
MLRASCRTRTVRPRRGRDVGARIAAAARWIAANLPVSALNTVIAAPGELRALRYPGQHSLYIIEGPAGPGEGPQRTQACTSAAPRRRCTYPHPSSSLPSDSTVKAAGACLPGELVHVRPDLSVQSDPDGGFPCSARVRRGSGRVPSLSRERCTTSAASTLWGCDEQPQPGAIRRHCPARSRRLVPDCRPLAPGTDHFGTGPVGGSAASRRRTEKAQHRTAQGTSTTRSDPGDTATARSPGFTTPETCAVAAPH